MSVNDEAIQQQPWMMPHEIHPHTCTWMAYGTHINIWEDYDLVQQVNENLRDIAIQIAFSTEPVFMLVRQSEMQQVQEDFHYHIQSKFHSNSDRKIIEKNIHYVSIPNMNDIWIRDTGPVFVLHPNSKDSSNTIPSTIGAIDFNFNAWGNKQKHQHDSKVAKFFIDYINTEQGNVLEEVTKTSSDKLCCMEITTSIIMEGGGIEVDGIGTALLTESCIINKNRNPTMTKQQCEEIIMPLLGVQKIIWLPGSNNDPHDITDGHIDGYARFVNSTTIVVANETDPYNEYEYDISQKHIQILRRATNVHNESYRIVLIDNPTNLPKPYKNDLEYCATYINYYVGNHIVVIPQFNDRNNDEKARTTFQELFPHHTIVPVNIDGIASGGGGIHCVTQQQPMY